MSDPLCTMGTWCLATYFVFFLTLKSFLAISDNFRPFLANLGPFFTYPKKIKSRLTDALVLLDYLERAVLLVSLVSFLPQKYLTDEFREISLT